MNSPDVALQPATQAARDLDPEVQVGGLLLLDWPVVDEACPAFVQRIFVRSRTYR